ncbi:MAG: M23 family metallopeptidase [Eubacteriales bacterium]|nr:M23 family metallopeptidase [Eubacteriales bacterium]
MAEKYYRPKYISHSRSNGGKTGKLSLNLGRKALTQLFAAMIIFLVLAVVSTSEVPAAEFITDQVRWMLNEDWKLNASLDNIKNVFGGNDKADAENSEGQDNQSIPTGTNNDSFKYSAEVLGISTLDVSKPINGVVTELFGERSNQQTGELEFHCGIDISVTGDEQVYAVHDGVVEKVGTDEDYGKFIKLSHGNGIYTVYARLTQTDIVEGLSVKKGDQIASVKEDAVAAVSHLHFEIWQDGMPQNPLIQLDRFYSIEPVG